MDEILKTVSKDKAFYVFISGFMLIAFTTALALGDLKWFIPGVYFAQWTGVVPIVLAFVFIFYAAQSLKSASPTRAILEKIQRFLRDRTSGVVLFSCIAIFHGTFTSLKSMLPELLPFAFDPALADIDEFIHGGPAWMRVRFLDGLTDMVRSLYSETWFLLTTGITFAMCMARPGRLRSQYIWTFLLCWSMLGILIAGCFLSAGPVYYDRLIDEGRFVDLTDRLTSLIREDNFSSQYPDLLWTAYVTKTAGVGTGISAFPSLHLAMATLFFLVAHRFNRLLGWVMLGYLCIIMLGSVHLGWHYAVDGYFSIIATTVIWKVVGIRLNAPERQIDRQRRVWRPWSQV